MENERRLYRREQMQGEVARKMGPLEKTEANIPWGDHVVGKVHKKSDSTLRKKSRKAVGTSGEWKASIMYE